MKKIKTLLSVVLVSSCVMFALPSYVNAANKPSKSEEIAVSSTYLKFIDNYYKQKPLFNKIFSRLNEMGEEIDISCESHEKFGGPSVEEKTVERHENLKKLKVEIAKILESFPAFKPKDDMANPEIIFSRLNNLDRNIDSLCKKTSEKILLDTEEAEYQRQLVRELRTRLQALQIELLESFMPEKIKNKAINKLQ